MPRIAEIDRAILAQLRKNARMSYVDLAREVGASERTVRTHIRAMEENGTIRGYTVRESGIGLTALIRIKVSPGVEIGSFASEVTGLDLRNTQEEETREANGEGEGDKEEEGGEGKEVWFIESTLAHCKLSCL